MQVLIKRITKVTVQELYLHVEAPPNICDAVADAVRGLDFQIVPRRCPATVSHTYVLTTVEDDHVLKHSGSIAFIYTEEHVWPAVVVEICDRLAAAGYGWMTKSEWDARLARIGGMT